MGTLEEAWKLVTVAKASFASTIACILASDEHAMACDLHQLSDTSMRSVFKFSHIEDRERVEMWKLFIS